MQLSFDVPAILKRVMLYLQIVIRQNDLALRLMVVHLEGRSKREFVLKRTSLTVSTDRLSFLLGKYLKKNTA